jgi:hypothetical protein
LNAPIPGVPTHFFDAEMGSLNRITGWKFDGEILILPIPIWHLPRTDRSREFPNRLVVASLLSRATKE